MQKLIYIILLVSCLFSCKGQQRKEKISSHPEFQQTFLDVVLDSTATWTQVVEASAAFADSLFIIANDPENGNNRIAAQQWGYSTVDLLIEKYIELKNAGRSVDYDAISPIIKRINDATSVWLYSDDKDLPHIWRDHMYFCHQESENPVKGFFHFMVTLPTEDRPESSLQLFFPESAIDVPVLIFGNYLDNTNLEEDFDNKDINPISGWHKKGEVQEGYPMYAEVGADMVRKMLDYDIMDIMFRSSVSPDGDPEEIEIARVSLEPFKEKWNSLVK